MKTYGYGAYGERLTIADGANRYSYLYSPHGDVSLLIDQANTVKQAYGYTAYGGVDSTITKSAAGFTDPNLYRYSAKRWDAATGTYDMGARRYSPATTRWLQQDMYYGAIDDLGLSQDPLTANRYQFTGANPINYLEVDGHYFVGDDGERLVPGPTAPGNSPAGSFPPDSGRDDDIGAASAAFQEEINHIVDGSENDRFLAGYPGPFDRLNDAERGYCTTKPWHWNQCMEVARIADAIGRYVKKLEKAQVFRSDGHEDGLADAFRHSLWTGTMTLLYGAATATGFGDRHESELAYPGPRGANARSMDLHNNAVGIALATSMGGGISAVSELIDALLGAAKPGGGVHGMSLWTLGPASGSAQTRRAGGYALYSVRTGRRIAR